MKKDNLRIGLVVMLLTLLGASRGMAQQNTTHSVLSEHTWLRMAVTEEGVYKLDYATLSAMGIDMEHLDPRQIRLFGNPSGTLPELNATERPDDLTEMAIFVSGADDGVFDADDYVLFYGQESTRWDLTSQGGKLYERTRNYYSDSTYYYLCTDSGTDGLRIGTQPTLPVEGATTLITEFPDFTWHEEEIFSPFSVTQNSYGEMLTSQNPELQMDFYLPHLVKTKPIYIKAELLGYAKDNILRFVMRANDHLLEGNGTIGVTPPNDYVYGRIKTVDKQMLSESDTVCFSLTLTPDPKGPILLLDYIEMFYWRKLIRLGDFFPFRLVPSQFGEDTTAVWVQNVSSACHLWEVTNPLRPVLQEGIQSANNFVFSTMENTEKRYALFELSGTKTIGSWTPVGNQNLHAIRNADMLILTLPMFWESANELARFHEQEDGLSSIVVDVNEIYNEFSTGTPSPVGIRDFVRMVYLRSGGQLKYLLLMGRPSYDFCDRKGYGRDMVPCYEGRGSSNSLNSTGSDDFFGMMDESEGKNSEGHIDIGIGRLPVSTIADAKAMVDKIKRYNDFTTNHGDWKVDALILADDEETGFVNSSEAYTRILDTVSPALNVTKIYTGAYPHVTTPEGIRIPQAHDDLIAALDKGVFMMAYSGHGGVKGLTSENVFALMDVLSLKNGMKQPFVYTATCEFSRYDNPLLVSAGERMFLLPNDGPIAMMTTTRPTFGNHNETFGKVLMNKVLCRDENGQCLRLGDVVRMTKADQANYSQNSPNGVSNSVNMVLLGDPAMRLALPQLDVVVTKINGNSEEQGALHAIHAMSMVSMEGEIRTPNGNCDTQFNGELWMTLFDKKTSVTVSFKDDPPRTVSYHKDVLYKGRVSVKNGKFTLSFQLPKDIQPNYGTPRFSFYATDTLRRVDAMGSFNRISLGGTDPAVLPDNEGPQISFYWNAPSFQNGDMVERDGVLYADLYDAQGIYHYDFSLGRDMLLNSNATAYDNMVLNAYYEPALDDYRRGRVAIPVSLRDGGTYEFSLKAWDMQNNSSTAQIWFVVGNDLFLSGVRNYPNPFQDETIINITHSGNEGDFHVSIELFDLMGRRVAVLAKDVYLSENQSAGVSWDGRDDFGRSLPTGVYLYRLTLTDEWGNARTVTQRMMITR